MGRRRGRERTRLRGVRPSDSVGVACLPASAPPPGAFGLLTALGSSPGRRQRAGGRREGSGARAEGWPGGSGGGGGGEGAPGGHEQRADGGGGGVGVGAGPVGGGAAGAGRPGLALGPGSRVWREGVRLRPAGAPGTSPPPKEHLLHRPGCPPQREEGGAGDAGGQAGVLWELVPSCRPDGAPGDGAAGPAAGGQGGDGPPLPAPDPAGRRGEGPRLDTLRLPGQAHRWDPEDPAGSRRRVPAGPVVEPQDAGPHPAGQGHPATHGAGPAVPGLPRPPSCPAGGAPLPLDLPAPAPPLHRRQRQWRGPVGAAGHGRGAPLARSGQRPVPLGAGGAAAGGGPPPAAEVPARPVPGLRPRPGPAGGPAPGQGAWPERRHLLQCGGHPGGGRPPPQGQPPGPAEPGLCLVEGGGRGPAQQDPPAAQPGCLRPRAQLGLLPPSTSPLRIVPLGLDTEQSQLRHPPGWASLAPAERMAPILPSPPTPRNNPFARRSHPPQRECFHQNIWDHPPLSP